jgi:peptidoglycan/LPS O-acetylase OafA/YrhL
VRNAYFDLLRALAIVRVVAYHATGWAALSYLFPAMGVMFALGGSLMAAAVDRYGPRAVWRRFRRTLPPLWTIGAVAVPLMVHAGMPADWHLIYWVLPLRDPPLYGLGGPALSAIWYLRQYLWFVLVSPLALPAFRRWPAVMLLAPFVVLVAFDLGLPNIVPLKDFGLYFGCWLIGFAQHDGLFERVSLRVTLPVSLALIAFGALWLFTHPGARGYDLNDVDLAQSLWSTGFAIGAFALAPREFTWLRARPSVKSLVAAVNQRSVTIYLWHQTVIVGLGTVLGLAGIPMTTRLERVPYLIAVFAGVAVCAVAVGWVEDLAARRRPVLVPA